MILPLRSTREVWAFDWFDLDVPIQFADLIGIIAPAFYNLHEQAKIDFRAEKDL